MEYSGIVQPGVQNASFWINKYQDAYMNWLNESIFAGSLNVNLGSPFNWNSKVVINARKIYSLKPYGGDREIMLIPITIFKHVNLPCWLWATTKALSNKEDPEVVELISSIHLRSELNLENGSIIEFKIMEN